MKNKKHLFILIIFVSLLSISAASAAEYDADDSISINDNNKLILEETINEELILEDNNNDEITLDESNEAVLSEGEEHLSFTDLNTTINGNEDGEIYLNNNYTFNPDSDSDFANGISINRNLTIHGNGFTLNGNNQARIFNITAEKVTLENIIFINDHTDANGGAIFINGPFANSIINSTFINNSAYNGGAIYINGASESNTIGGEFRDNTAANCGGGIYLKDTSTGNKFIAEFYNNTANAEKRGGGIFFRNTSSNDYFESIFMYNNAMYGAGIFFNYEANNNIFNSDFRFNKAGSCGGAMFFRNRTNHNTFKGTYINNTVWMFSWTHCSWFSFKGTYINNTGLIGNGGAITFKDVSENSLFECDFINNTAGDYGGAVNYRESPKNITFNTNFINNTAKYGGGVNFFESFDEVVFNGEFNGNKAIERGGGIASKGGKIENTIFTNNSAYSGGAIYLNGTGNIENCIFNDNNARENGGALNLENSTNTVIENCRFNKNYGKRGGAIYSENASINLSNCNIDSNSAMYAIIYLQYGELSTVNLCNFTNNNATTGYGCVYFAYNNGIVNNSYFKNNTGAYGVGVYFYYEGIAENCAFINNKMEENILPGTAIYFDDGFGKVNNCNFTNNSGGNALYFSDNAGIVNNSNFNYNKGGAIHINSFDNYGIVENSNFTNNENDRYTPGVYINGNGMVNNCNFINHTSRGIGGALFIGYEGIVNNSNFINNSVSEGYSTQGGAIQINRKGTVDNCNFINNSASRIGGAILFNSEGHVNNSNFTNNKITGTDNNPKGGAIHFSSSIATIENSNFDSNQAPHGGAVTFFNNGTIYNCSFTNNKAQRGGAIYAEYNRDSLTNITQCTFESNSAEAGGAIYYKNQPDFDGGKIHIVDSNFTNNNVNNSGAAYINCENGAVINSTFNSNTAENGGAIKWHGKYGKVSTCLFINNTATINGSVYYNDDGGNSYSNFTNNILLNNGPKEIIYEVFEGSNVDYNWFGNNEQDFDQKPYDQSKVWLFLNGTADPEQIPVFSTSNIIFNLYAYDEATGEITEFDDQIYPITLSLSSINGTLSNNTVGLKDTISYSPERYGLGSVTASIENAKSTITIVSIPEDAELDVSIGDTVIDYGENATILLEFDQRATGTVNITLKSKKQEITITEKELKGSIPISGFNADEYTITVSYSGDEKFKPETKTASTTLTVNKVNSTVNVQDATTEWNVPVSIPVSVEGVEGYPATEMVIVTVGWAEDNISKVYYLEDGMESVTFKIDETVGECKITVMYLGDENYYGSNATARLTITESTDLIVEVTDNSPVEGQDLIITVTATDGRGEEVPITKVNISIDGGEVQEVDVDENGNANLGKLPEGPHTVVISVNDGVHKEETVTKEIVVNPTEITPTEIVVTVENISYGENPTIEFTFKDITGTPLSGTLNVTVADKEYLVTVNAEGKGTLTIPDILPADTYPVVAIFAGNKTHAESTGTGYFNITKNATMIIFENMQTKAVDPKLDGKTGEWFYFTLKDANGAPIANTPMEIGFNGLVYTYEKDGICTDENGVAKLQINLGYKGDYTFAICYLGNQSYNASFVVANISVSCQKPTLTVPNKSYAASAKTKTLTATFKNKNGKLIIDKWISFTVNGKTYKAKTNSKGVASVNVNLTTKGTYTVVAKWAGDSTYNAVNKTAKLTIK